MEQTQNKVRSDARQAAAAEAAYILEAVRK